MKEHPVLWIPGLDHAGIATQAIVERTLQHTRNITRHDIGRAEFTQLLWQWKKEKTMIINQQLKTLGATLDWDKEYFTIDQVISIYCIYFCHCVHLCVCHNYYSQTHIYIYHEVVLVES